MSQAVLARLLGFENAQCISNVERGSSRIPFRKIERLVAVLNINPEELKAAMMKDFELELDYYLHLSNNQNEEAFSSSCDIQIQAH